MVERVRYLGQRKCEIVTVTRGPAPAIDVNSEGDEATLTIGRLTVGVKGEKVVVTIGKDGRDAPTRQHPSN